MPFYDALPVKNDKDTITVALASPEDAARLECRIIMASVEAVGAFYLAPWEDEVLRWVELQVEREIPQEVERLKPSRHAPGPSGTLADHHEPQDGRASEGS
jgi:hypothetical protein